MAVRIEKILCTVLHEAHMRPVEETMDTQAEGPEGFYESQAESRKVITPDPIEVCDRDNHGVLR